MPILATGFVALYQVTRLRLNGRFPSVNWCGRMSQPQLKTEPPQRSFATALWNVLAPAALLLVIAAATVGIAQVIVDNFATIKLWWFVLVALPVAWPLFVLRYHQRLIYGFIEIVIGSFTANQTYNAGALLGSTKLLTLAAAIYVIIRGLDNVDQGLKRFCQQFLVAEDAFILTYYWEVCAKGQFARRARRGIYRSMIRPIWRKNWEEFEQLTKWTNRTTWATPYWFARKNFMETFTNENIANISRIDKYTKR